MTSALESKAALQVIVGAAVGDTSTLLGRLSGTAKQKRTLLLDATPEIIAYYADGSSALAADYYDDAREAAAAPKLYVAEPIVVDRTEKIRRGVAWASEPLFDGDSDEALGRLSGIVQSETSRPYRDTILRNRTRDASAVGWRRVTNGGCKMCRMLAERGAVYTDQSARFAAHDHCKCTAQPVFSSEDFGEEASVMQYVASKKRRTPAQQANLRDYLNTNYSDFHG